MVSWWSPRQIPAISQLEPVVEEFVGGSLIAQGCDFAGSCERVGVEDDLQGAGLGMIPSENDRFPAGAFVKFRGWVHSRCPKCSVSLEFPRVLGVPLLGGTPTCTEHLYRPEHHRFNWTPFGSLASKV